MVPFLVKFQRNYENLKNSVQTWPKIGKWNSNGIPFEAKIWWNSMEMEMEWNKPQNFVPRTTLIFAPGSTTGFKNYANFGILFGFMKMERLRVIFNFLLASCWARASANWNNISNIDLLDFINYKSIWWVICNTNVKFQIDWSYGYAVECIISTCTQAILWPNLFA